MSKVDRLLRPLPRLAFLVLAAVNVYRAATQSLTHDEAWNWQLVLHGGFRDLFSTYQPNHHVLHSLMAWCSLQVFGESDFAQRFPALIAGILFMDRWIAFTNRKVESPAWRLLVVLVVITNPLLLDHMVIARGYGISLLGLLVALDAADRAAASPTLRARHGWEWLVGGGCAVAVTTVPSTLPLVLSLIASSLVVDRRGEPTQGDRESPIRRCMRLALPPTVLGVALYLPLISEIRRSQFEYGAASIDQAISSLHETSIAGLEIAGRSLDSIEALLRQALGTALGITLLFVLLVATSVSRRALRGDADARSVVRPVLALLIAALMVESLRRSLALPLPKARTALPWLLALAVAVVASIRCLERKSAPRIRRAVLAPFAAAACLLIAVHVANLRTDHFAEWRYDADAARVFETIERLAANRSTTKKLSVGCYFLSEPVMNVYRVRRNATWLEPVAKEIRPSPGREVYVLLPGRDEGLVARHLDVVATFPLSGVSIAVPRESTTPPR